MLSYGENPESLSHLGLNRYRVVTDGLTDGQTDRITITNTRLALRKIVSFLGPRRRKSVKVSMLAYSQLCSLGKLVQ